MLGMHLLPTDFNNVFRKLCRVKKKVNTDHLSIWEQIICFMRKKMNKQHKV